MEGMEEQMREAWGTNHRVNLFLLERISEEGLRCSLSRRGGRDVARQFAHLHDVRVWHLRNRGARDLAEGLEVFASKESPPRERLREAHEASAAAVERYLAGAMAGEPRRRTFRKGWLVHLSYFIAHESHHRGSILLTLKECGHKLDQESAYAIWNWDRI